MSAESPFKERVYWIDNAKAFGIIALFYGHVVEKIFLTYSSVAYLQYKLIYSFHISLFFILSGYIAKQPESNIHSFIKDKFMSRFIPFVFFNILILPVYLISDVIMQKKIDLEQLIVTSMLLIRGAPVFNPMTWFLVCLFSVELIHFFVSPYITNNRNRICFFMILFYIVGWLISWKRSLVVGILQLGDFWFFYEAIAAYSFYLFGKLIYTSNIGSRKFDSYLNILFLMLSAILLVSTFNLNQGPFLGEHPNNVVLIWTGTYGNIFFFPLTAIAGSLCFIILSKLIGPNRLFEYLGRNSLILMGLNGFYFQFINTFLVNQGIKFISGSSLSIVVLCGVLTFISLLLCIPFILLLEKYLPQLTGKPKVKGPILPSLIN